MSEIWNVDPQCEPPANMYGCTACPKCKGEHRFVDNANFEVVCDDCGFEEPIREKKG